MPYLPLVGLEIQKIQKPLAFAGVKMRNRPLDTEIFSQPVSENQIITVREAAKLLRVSTKTIYKKVSRDEIPHKRVGSKIRFLLPVLMEWMKG